MHYLRPQQVALCLLFGTLLVACKSSDVSAQTSSAGYALSGPPVAFPQYAARMPRRCAKVTSPPTQAEAKALVQCGNEGIFQNDLWLNTDLVVVMGPGRKMNMSDVGINDFDSSAEVYPLTGSGTNWSCSVASLYAPGKNCEKFPSVPSYPGRCFKTLSTHEWKCKLGVGSAGSAGVANQPGPTTY